MTRSGSTVKPGPFEYLRLLSCEDKLDFDTRVGILEDCCESIDCPIVFEAGYEGGLASSDVRHRPEYRLGLSPARKPSAAGSLDQLETIVHRHADSIITERAHKEITHPNEIGDLEIIRWTKAESLDDDLIAASQLSDTRPFLKLLDQLIGSSVFYRWQTILEPKQGQYGPYYVVSLRVSYSPGHSRLADISTVFEPLTGHQLDPESSGFEDERKGFCLRSPAGITPDGHYASFFASPEEAVRFVNVFEGSAFRSQFDKKQRKKKWVAEGHAHRVLEELQYESATGPVGNVGSILSWYTLGSFPVGIATGPAIAGTSVPPLEALAAVTRESQPAGLLYITPSQARAAEIDRLLTEQRRPSGALYKRSVQYESDEQWAVVPGEYDWTLRDDGGLRIEYESRDHRITPGTTEVSVNPKQDELPFLAVPEGPKYFIYDQRSGSAQSLIVVRPEALTTDWQRVAAPFVPVSDPCPYRILIVNDDPGFYGEPVDSRDIGVAPREGELLQWFLAATPHSSNSQLVPNYDAFKTWQEQIGCRSKLSRERVEDLIARSIDSA